MKPTLLVLAAGMGSRYGSLKQLDAIGPNGETIIDYSVFDALRAGFGKVVFIIRESFAFEFEEKVVAKFRDRIKIAYAFQPMDVEFEDIQDMPPREKPWGTGHAVLVAKDIIKEPFAVVNADDYYGITSFQKMADFLTRRTTSNHYSMVGFILSKTLSDNGSVSRGICHSNENHYLKNVVETTNIERVDGNIHFDSDGNKGTLTDNTLVSMNLWGFHPAFFETLEIHFKQFVRKNYKNPRSEFYIPLVVNELIENEEAMVEVIPSVEKWYGVTYKEDKPIIQDAIRKMTMEGLYPNPLWS